MRSGGQIVKGTMACLRTCRVSGTALFMADRTQDDKKGERLGEALRANLRRRKAPAKTNELEKAEAPPES